MKKWLFTILAILVVSSMVLTACGPQEAPPEVEEAEEAEEVEEVEEEETEEEPAAEEVTLRIFAGNVGKELELTKAAAARYMEANPNVTVEVVDTPDFVEDRLGVYLQLFEAQSPEGDVFQIDVIWPGDLAEHFVDLYEYGAEEVAGDHFPAIIENNTVDGKLVGIPWFTDAGLLYYRTDLLEKYGYDGPPATWRELENMARAIQAGERDEGNQDFWGFVWQGNAYEGLTCDALEWVYSNGGGTIVSPDKVITVNNEAAIAAVETAAGWVDTISPAGVTGFGEEDARGVWQAGNAAFMRNWPYAYSLGQADDSVIKDLFDVSPLPAGASGRAATLGGWQLAVSKYSEHPEAAADLALFMASYDEQKARAIEGSFNPTIMSLYEDEDVLEATPFFGSLYDVFINAVARPSTATAPNYAETSRIFFNGVHSVLTGDTDALTAFEAMEADMVDLLGYEIGAPAAMPEIKEELEIYSWWAGDEGPALEALIDLYSEMYPNVEVINATVAGGSGVNAKAVLKTRMLGGDPPDTFQVHAGQELIGTWVVEDKMEDLTFLYEEEGWFDKYPQGLLDLLSTEDGIWSVPVNIHRSNVLWYIPENLEGWGVEAPETWDDFLAICPALQDQGVVPLSLGTNWTHNHLWEAVAVAELGVDGWNALWTGEKAWTDDDVVAAWDKFGQILECTNEDATTLSWQQASDMVINGEAAFNEMGDWANGYFETTKGLEPGVDYAWSPAPGTDGVFIALSDSFGLPQGAPNREAVINWLRLMGSVEGQDTFNPLKGSIAAHTDSDLTLYSAYSQSAAEDWANDTVVASLAHGAAANETFMNGFASAMELYLSSGDAEATSAALQELCVDSGICQ